MTAARQPCNLMQRPSSHGAQPVRQHAACHTYYVLNSCLSYADQFDCLKSLSLIPLYTTNRQTSVITKV